MYPPMMAKMWQPSNPTYGLDCARQIAAIDALPITQSSSDCLRVGHRLSHMLALMTPDTAAMIDSHTVVPWLGPAGLPSIRIGSAASNTAHPKVAARHWVSRLRSSR